MSQQQRTRAEYTNKLVENNEHDFMKKEIIEARRKRGKEKWEAGESGLQNMTQESSDNRVINIRLEMMKTALEITNVHDVPIAELPVRVLGDCLRGSVALHCDCEF